MSQTSMVNPAYKIEQGIAIPICVVFSLTSSYQLYLAYRLHQATSKRNIHLVSLLQPLCCLLNESDPWGLYGRVPVWASRFGLNLGLLFGGAGLALVIYSHFQAHYSTLRRDVPRYLLYALTGTVSLFFLCLLVAGVAVYSFGKHNLRVMGTFGSVQFLGVTGVTDFVGFLLIYRLLIDLKDKKEMPHQCNSDNTFQLLLRRMYTFHGFILTLDFGTFLYYFQSAIQEAIKGSVPDGPKSPSQYELVGTLPAVLVGWIACTWWAWIPRPTEDDTARTTSKEKSNSGPHHRSNTLTHTETHRPVLSPVSSSTSPLTDTADFGSSRDSLQREEGHPNTETRASTNQPSDKSPLEDEQLLILRPSSSSSQHGGVLPSPSAAELTNNGVELSVIASVGGSSAPASPEVSVLLDRSEGGGSEKGGVTMPDDVANVRESSRKIFNPFVSAEIVEEGNEASE